MLMKSNNNVLLPSVLALITILTRIPFTSKILSNWDSVQFALAIEKYDITVHQPHPPGYFLYVMLGKFLNLFIADINMSFIAMSIMASGLTVFFIFLLAREIYDTKIAFWSSVLAITSPLVWFHGEIALTYIFDAFFSIFFAFLCWKILNGQFRLIFISALVLAFIGGVRQSTLVFLIPLWLYSIRKAPYKYIIISFALFVAGILSWFLPMLSMTGGYERYKAAVDEHWAYTMHPSTVINGGLKNLISNSKDIIQFTTYGLGLAIAFDVFYLVKSGFKDVRSLSSRTGIFITLWILPAILFYLLFYMGGYGYCLIFMPALFILSVKAFNCLSEKSSYPLKAFTIIIFLTITFNLYYFFYTRSPASLYIIERNYTDTMDFVKAVREKFSPADTVILSYDYQFRGPRHFMYYMPEYKVYIMDNRVDMLGRSRRIYWGQNRNTFVSDKTYIPKGIKYFLSPMDDNIFLAKTGKPEENIKILSMGEKDVAFYGDISLAPETYRGITFAIGNEGMP